MIYLILNLLRIICIIYKIMSNINDYPHNNFNEIKISIYDPDKDTHSYTPNINLSHTKTLWDFFIKYSTILSWIIHSDNIRLSVQIIKTNNKFKGMDPLSENTVSAVLDYDYKSDGDCSVEELKINTDFKKEFIKICKEHCKIN